MPTHNDIVTTYFKEKTHVKLKGAAYTKLKIAVFDRDGWRCIECGNADRGKLTLSHIIHKGMGGGKGPGDTMENTCCRCIDCHQKEEHGQDGRVKR